MITYRGTGQVRDWFIVFEPMLERRLWNTFIPGRFKHVFAFGYVPEVRTWVLIDPAFSGMETVLIPAHEFIRYMSKVTPGCAILKMTARKSKGCNLRLVACCTSAVRNILGLPGRGIVSALPSVLYRDCLRAGAEVVYVPSVR